jgi:hypothetical protein
LSEEWNFDDASLLVLRAALEARDRGEQARLEIAKHGLLLPDRFGVLHANAACQVEKDARLAYLRALRQLGLDIEPAGPRGRPPGGGGK